VLAVRRAVGLFDNSPIGKLEVFGPDAATFLERLYINAVGSLAVGRVRYGLMLNEKGVIVDDGVFARLSEDHFLVNTTSAGVSSVRETMEEWLQCDWPDLDVLVDDVTTQWCNFTLAGPQARTVLATVLEATGAHFDQDPMQIPHMTACSGTIDGKAARILRVSFSGEASFEINAPARMAGTLWQRLLAAGAPQGIAPYGIEALMLLRAEKGYLHIGTDTDGTTLPGDVGWGEVALRKPSDYIGRRSLLLEAARDPERRQFVGLESIDGAPLTVGGHVLLGEGRRPPARTDGWVTYAAHSPTLGNPIALATVRAGRRNLGEIVTVCDEAGQRRARIVQPAFYDPANRRLEHTDA
jgi:sarcosine oxidase subunit alpha